MLTIINGFANKKKKRKRMQCEIKEKIKGWIHFHSPVVMAKLAYSGNPVGIATITVAT